MLAAFLRSAPSFKGKGRIARIVNNAFNYFGAEPIVSAQMKNGTQMRLDLRAETEFPTYYTGDYDENLLRQAVLFTGKDGVFVDVGANIGFWSVAVGHFIKQGGGSGRVLSFEPLLENHQRLVENIALNQLSQICAAYHLGLSDSAREAGLVLRKDFSAGSNTGNASIAIHDRIDKGFKSVKIKLARFDDEWGPLEVEYKKIDFIKVDIEGHEDYFLAGAAKALQKYRPVILLEVNKFFYEARGVDVDRVLRESMPPHYLIFKKQGRHWKEIHSFDECSNVDNVFLAPEENGQIKKMHGI